MRKLLLFLFAATFASNMRLRADTVDVPFSISAGNRYYTTFIVQHSDSTKNTTIRFNGDGDTTLYTANLSPSGTHSIAKTDGTPTTSATTIAAFSSFPARITYWVYISENQIQIGHGQLGTNPLLTYNGSSNEMTRIKRMEIATHQLADTGNQAEQVSQSGTLTPSDFVSQWTSLGTNLSISSTEARPFVINTQGHVADSNNQLVSFDVPGGTKCRIEVFDKHMDGLSSDRTHAGSWNVTAPAGATAQIVTSIKKSSTSSNQYSVAINAFVDGTKTELLPATTITTVATPPPLIQLTATGPVSNITYPEPPSALTKDNREGAYTALNSGTQYVTFDLLDNPRTLPLGIVLASGADGSETDLYEFRLGLGGNKAASLIVKNSGLHPVPESDTGEGLDSFFTSFGSNQSLESSVWERTTPLPLGATDGDTNHTRFDYLSPSMRDITQSANSAFTLPSGEHKMFLAMQTTSSTLSLALGTVSDSTHTIMLAWRSPIFSEGTPTLPSKIKFCVPDDKFSVGALTSSDELQITTLETKVAPESGSLPADTVFTHLDTSYSNAAQIMNIAPSETRGQQQVRTISTHRLPASTETVPATSVFTCAPKSTTTPAIYIQSFGESSGSTVPVASDHPLYSHITELDDYPVQFVSSARVSTFIGGATNFFGFVQVYCFIRGQEPQDFSPSFSGGSSWVLSHGAYFSAGTGSIPGKSPAFETTLPEAIVDEMSNSPLIRYSSKTPIEFSNITSQLFTQTADASYTLGSLSFTTHNPTFDQLQWNASSTATPFLSFPPGFSFSLNAIPDPRSSGNTLYTATTSQSGHASSTTVSAPQATQFTLDTSEHGISLSCSPAGGSPHILHAATTHPDTDLIRYRFGSFIDPIPISDSSITTTFAPDMSGLESTVGVTQDPGNENHFVVQGNGEVVYNTGTETWRDTWELTSGAPLSFTAEAVTGEADPTKLFVFLNNEPHSAITFTQSATGLTCFIGTSSTISFSNYATWTGHALPGTYTISLDAENRPVVTHNGTLPTNIFKPLPADSLSQLSFGAGSEPIALSNIPTSSFEPLPADVLSQFSFGAGPEPIALSNISNASYNGAEPSLSLSPGQQQAFTLTADINPIGASSATGDKAIITTLSSPTGTYRITTTITTDAAGSTLAHRVEKKLTDDSDFSEITNSGTTVPTGAVHHLSDWLTGSNQSTWFTFDHGVISLSFGSDAQTNPIFSFFDADALTDLASAKVETTGGILLSNTTLKDLTTHPVIFSARTTEDVIIEKKLIPILASTDASATRTCVLPKKNQTVIFSYEQAGSEKMYLITVEGDTVSLNNPEIPVLSNQISTSIPLGATQFWIAFGPTEDIAIGHGSTPNDTNCLLQWGTGSDTTFQTIGIQPQGDVGEATYNLPDLTFTEVAGTEMETFRTHAPSESTSDEGILTLSNLRGRLITNADGTWKNATSIPTPDNIDLVWEMTTGTEPVHIMLGATNSGTPSVQITYTSDTVTITDQGGNPHEVTHTLTDRDDNYELSYIAPILTLKKDGDELVSHSLTSVPTGINTVAFSTDTGPLTLANIAIVERGSETFSTTTAPQWIPANNSSGIALLEGVLSRNNSGAYSTARLQFGNETDTEIYTPVYYVDIVQSATGTAVTLHKEGEATELAKETDASLTWIADQHIPFSLLYDASGGTAYISFSIGNETLLDAVDAGTPELFTLAAVGSFEPETPLGTYSLITFDDVQTYATTDQLTAYFSNQSTPPFLFWRPAHRLSTPSSGVVSGTLQYASITDSEKVSTDDRVLTIALGSDNAGTPDAEPHYLLELHTGTGKIALTDNAGDPIASSDLTDFDTDPHPYFKLESNASQKFSLSYDNGALTFICGDALDADNRIVWSENLAWLDELIATSSTLSRVGFGYSDTITDTSIERGARATFSDLSFTPVTGQVHTNLDKSYTFPIDAVSPTENQLSLTALVQKEAGESTSVLFGLGSDTREPAPYVIKFSYNGTSTVSLRLFEPDGTETGSSIGIPASSAWLRDLTSWNAGQPTPLWLCLYEDTLMMGTGTVAGVNPFWKHTLARMPTESLTHIGCASENGTVMVTDLTVTDGIQEIGVDDYTWITVPNSSEYVRMAFTSSAEKEMFIGLQIASDTTVSYQFKVGAFNNNQTEVVRQGEDLESSLKLPGSEISVSIPEADLAYTFEFYQGTAKLSYLDTSNSPQVLFHYTDTNFASTFDSGTTVTRIGLQGGIPFTAEQRTFEDAPTSGSFGGPTTVDTALTSDGGDGGGDGETGTGSTPTDPVPFELTNITQTNTIVFDFAASVPTVNESDDPILDSDGNPTYDFYNANVSSHHLPSFEDLAWGLISRPLSVDMNTGFSLTSEFKFTSPQYTDPDTGQQKYHGRKIAVIGLRANRELPENGAQTRIIHNDSSGNPIVFTGCDDAAYVLLIQDVSELTTGPSTLSLKLYQPQATTTSNLYGQALEIDSKLIYLSSNVHQTPHLLQLTSLVDSGTLFNLKILPKGGSQPDWSTVPSAATWTWNPPASGTYDRTFTHAILSAWNTAITYRNYLLSPPETSGEEIVNTGLIPTTGYTWHRETALTTNENGGGGALSGTMSINQNPNSKLMIGLTSSSSSNLEFAQSDYLIRITPTEGDTVGSIEFQQGSSGFITHAPRNAAILGTIGNPNAHVEIGYIADINRETRTFFIFVNRTSTDPITLEDATTADWTYTEAGVLESAPPLRHIGFRSVGTTSTISDITLVPMDGPEPPEVDTAAPTALTVEAGNILWGGTEAQKLLPVLDGSGGGQLVTDISFDPEAGQTVEATIALTSVSTSDIVATTEPTYLLVVTPPTGTTTQSSVSLFKGDVLIAGTETGHADLNSTPSHIWVRYLKRATQNEFYVGFGSEVDFGGTVWRGVDSDIATTPSMLHFGLGAQGTGGAANPGIGTIAYDNIVVVPKPILTTITTNHDEVIWGVQGEITPLAKQLNTDANEYLGGLFEASLTLDSSVLGQEFIISLTTNDEADLGKLADYKLTLYPNSGEAGLEKRDADAWSIVEGTYKASSKISGLTSVTGAPHKLWFMYMPLWNSREYALGIWHANETESLRTEPLWKWAQDNAILKWSEPITPYDEANPDASLPSLKQFGVSTPAVSVALNNVSVTPLTEVDADRIAQQQADANTAHETEKRGTINEDGLPELSLWQNATTVHRLQAQSGAPGQRTITVSGQPEDRIILAFTKDEPGLTGAYVEEPEIAFRIIFAGGDRPESTYWPARGMAITSDTSLSDNLSEQLRPEGKGYNIQLSEGEVSVYSTTNPDLGYVWWNDDILDYTTANGYTFGPWYFTIGKTEGAFEALTAGSYVESSSTTAGSLATPQNISTVRRYG